MNKNASTRHIARQVTGLIISLLTTVATLANPTPSPADMVIHGNKVITMTKAHQSSATAKSLAIDNGHIVWMGEASAAQRYVGVDTQVVELGDQTLLPGFIDAHGHASFTALSTTIANVASPPVGPVATIRDLQNTLSDYIRARQIPAGNWVIGMGYDDSLIREQRHPTREDLDQVSSDHPIMLMHVSGHLVTANSRALARGGISAETPNPPGGIIRRQAGSNVPNGVLEESATGALRQYMAAANTNPLASISDAMRVYASYGITTVQDGAANPDVISLLQAAAAQQLLSLDVVAYPFGMQDPDKTQADYIFGKYANRLKIGGIKLSFDGSPQGKTAYLSKPYHIPPHNQTADYRGYPAVPNASAESLVKQYLDAQIPLIVHANGDAAAQMLVDAVALAKPSHDHRTVMIHAQTVREDQLTRMKSLNIIPSYFSTHTFYWGDWHRDSVLGIERASRISPAASTVARGMPYTVHNDAPVVPPDMIRLLWATTNRKTRSGKVLGMEQRVSTYSALQAMTIFAAYQYFEEDQKGSLEVGKLADLVVLSADPLTTSMEDLLRLRVEKTFSRGHLVYDRPTE